MNKPILVVEDNVDNMYVLDHLLTRKGYQVVQAVSGEDGLRQLTELEPALVLLDMQMPGMNGYMMVEALRRQQRLLRVPVIAVTASSMPGDRERALAAGCTDYIAKPINPREVLEIVARYVQGAPSGNHSDR
ncbi:MAG: hypothetical protein NVS4B8_05250 [Herpetosiphon sp.]